MRVVCVCVECVGWHRRRARGERGRRDRLQTETQETTSLKPPSSACM